MELAIAHEISTRFTKSLESNCHRLNTLAPSTFLTLISFNSCSAASVLQI